MTLEEAAEALDDLDLKYEIMDTTNYNPEFPYKQLSNRFLKPANM